MRFILFAVAALYGSAAASAGDVTHIHVDSCKIQDATGNKRTLDCTAAVAKICDGQAACEVPIGMNLHGGTSVSEGAKVTIGYSCGIARGQSGPNEVDDHAAVTMACTMMNSWPETR
jgi:hypothetical protein